MCGARGARARRRRAIAARVSDVSLFAHTDDARAAVRNPVRDRARRRAPSRRGGDARAAFHTRAASDHGQGRTDEVRAKSSTDAVARRDARATARDARAARRGATRRDRGLGLRVARCRRRGDARDARARSNGGVERSRGIARAVRARRGGGRTRARAEGGGRMTATMGAREP